jgi:ferrous iron transport protein A
MTTLDAAALDTPLTVTRLTPAPGAPLDWLPLLDALGFLPGEQVTVLSRAPWGGDRMVVRVGLSTFALRQSEAACVCVEAQAAAPSTGIR